MWQLSLLLAVPLCTGMRPKEVEEEVLDQSTTEPFKVLVFSDVHGTCTTIPGGWAEGKGIVSYADHMRNFAASTVGKAIEKSSAHLLIFGGDASTIPKEVACTEENLNELKEFVKWFAAVQPDKPKLFIGGNHDVCLDDTMTRSDTKLDAERVALIAEMRTKNIIFIGAAGWVKFKVGDKDFKIILSSISEGRGPGAEKKTVEECGLTGKEPKEFTVQQLKDAKCAPNALVGAFQYCPTASFASYVDCDTVYQKTTDMLEEASGKLGGEADLAVIHGPPDNLGFAFGPPNNEPNAMARALMKPLLEKKGKMRAGHYHLEADWKGKTTHQTLECKTTDCDGQVELKFVPVKQRRPEECETEIDDQHTPKEDDFTEYQVEQGFKLDVGQMEYGNVRNQLTTELLKKFVWDGPTFNTPSENMKYTVQEKKTSTGAIQVFVPCVVSNTC